MSNALRNSIKLRRWTSPLEYEDCDPTGVVDATTAFQIAAAKLDAGANAYAIGDGSFKVSDTITIEDKHGFTLTGAGLVTQSAANKPILQLLGCTNFRLEGLRLVGYGADYVAAVDTSLGIGIWLEECSEFTVEKAMLQKFGYAGLFLQDCSDFDLVKNGIRGTHALGAAIANGDTYQFGIIMKSGAGLAHPCTDFAVRGNRIRDVAIGTRIEPNAKRFAISGGITRDIRGLHGFYINGSKFTISDEVIDGVPNTAIKLQHYQNTGLGVNTPISNAAVDSCVISTCLIGVSIEKTSAAADDGANVTVSDTDITDIGPTGMGIFVSDTINTVLSGNQTSGGAYGICANVTTAGHGVSGKIVGNRCADTQWAAIFAYALEHLDVSDNDAIHPNLAAVGTDPERDAFYVSGAPGARVSFDGNTLVVGASTGVVNGLYAANVELALGANDLADKPIAHTGATIKKRAVAADFEGVTAWTGIGAIGNGAVATKVITVTGAALGDGVAHLSLASDLQGCSLSGYVSAPDVLTVVITNNTGSGKTISDASIRWGVMRAGV
jgi:hypothetical protein